MPRSLGSFQSHLDKTVANCSTSFLVLRRSTIFGDEFMVTHHMCKSNYCKLCRPKNLIALRKVLYESLNYHRWRMIDLTFPDHSVDPLTALQSIYKTFKQFIQKVRYKYPDIAFVRTIEIHQSGFPHLHMIVDKYIPVAFIQKCWHDQGGGQPGRPGRRPRATRNGRRAARAALDGSHRSRGMAGRRLRRGPDRL